MPTPTNPPPITSLALVAPLPPPSGGMANQARQLAELLRGEGIEVQVVQTNAPYQPAWVGRIQGVRALFRLVPYIAALWRAAGRCQVLHVLANSGWSWHLFAAPALWIAKARGTPVIINYRGGEAGEFFARAMTWVRPSLKQARLIAVPSGFLREIFERYGFRAEIVPNIINLQRFTPREHGAEWTLAPHFVVTRNLEAIYDIATVLRAFARIRAQVPGARLSVAGSGPLAEELRRLAETLGIAEATTFTGRLDNERLPELYRDAHIMLNASRVDNFPISILEALASGLPVVSTAVGGIPYLVEHEQTALLVAAGDDQAMADAALRLLAEADLYARLRSAGLVLIRRYDWENVRGGWFDLYGKAVSGLTSR